MFPIFKKSSGTIFTIVHCPTIIFMDIWRSNKQFSNFDKICPIQTADSSFMDKTIGQEHVVKWSPDIGETVHEDMTPKDYFTNHSLLKHFLAGGVAGCVSRTTTAPIDRLKVFIQVNKDYKVSSAAKYLYQEGGIRALWRGNFVNVLKIAPESAIKFMAYEEVKRMIKKSNYTHSELNIFDRFLAGALAGAIAQAFIYPLEVVKTRMALRKTGEGLMRITSNIKRNGGILGFYKGFVPNFIGIFPYAGIDLAVYETLKNLWIKKHHDTKPGVKRIIICGIISSTSGQLVTYPLALVRTRLQALAIMNDENQPPRMITQFKYILKNDGIPGLYRGFIPNFLKVMPAVAISYITYEKCRTLMGASMS